MTAEHIAHALGARRSGAGWSARCPAHKDRTPSLSICRSKDGKLLVHCHAGCAQADVIDALKGHGLWPERQRREWWEESCGALVATYDYRDEQGKLLYQVCRFVPKTFRPRRPDGSGGWKWGYGGVRRVLYRLPELLQSPIVFVPEGERDVETLRAYGFAATTNPGGAKGWRDDFGQYFAGREAIILPDDDPPGWSHALRKARSILPFAATVRILAVPGAKDISDWFSNGHSELELIAQVEGVPSAP
jgi:putative DNA primase/helicase